MLLPWWRSAVAAGNYSGLSASGDAPNWHTVAESDSWTRASQTRPNERNISGQAFQPHVDSDFKTFPGNIGRSEGQNLSSFMDWSTTAWGVCMSIMFKAATSICHVIWWCHLVIILSLSLPVGFVCDSVEAQTYTQLPRCSLITHLLSLRPCIRTYTHTHSQGTIVNSVLYFLQAVTPPPSHFYLHFRRQGQPD